MNTKQKQLIDTLLQSLPITDLPHFTELIEALTELGYKPYKRATVDFSLDFKHKETKKQIAQVFASKNGGEFRMKYSSCKDVPERFITALHSDFPSLRRLKEGRTPHNEVKNFCGLCGDMCTSGGWGYVIKAEDGREILRCGAYPPAIPIADEQDVIDIKRLMLEQHQFLMEKWA